MRCNFLFVFMGVLGVATVMPKCGGLCASSYYQYITTLPPKADLPEKETDQQPHPRTDQEDSYFEECEPCMQSCTCDEPVEVAFSPSYRGLCCDFGAFIEVDFLYWYAKETNLSYALALTEQAEIAGSQTLLFGAKTVENLKTSWDPGIRVGLGFVSEFCDLDFGFRWTWLKNSSHNSIRVPEFSASIEDEVGEVFLLVPWINQSFHRNTFALWDDVRARWRFTINQIDVEIGRKYWTGCAFSLRPFAGVRAAFWDTKFDVKSGRQDPDAPSRVDSHDHFDNDAWGVGPVLGLQPTWHFTDCFAIYGGVDIAVLWGRHCSEKQERIVGGSQVGGPLETDYRNHFSSAFYMMTAQLDAEAGIRLETTWCACRFRTALDIGFEHHILFDQNHRIQTFENFLENGEISGFRTYREATGNIGYGGLVIRGRFDF